MAAGTSKKATEIVDAFEEDSGEEVPARGKSRVVKANPGCGQKRKGKEVASIDWE